MIYDIANKVTYFTLILQLMSIYDHIARKGGTMHLSFHRSII
jgi:hypothetical protein